MSTNVVTTKVSKTTLDEIQKLEPEGKESLIDLFHKNLFWFKKFKYSIYEIVHDNAINDEIGEIIDMNVLNAANENDVYMIGQDRGWECMKCGVLSNEHPLEHAFKHYLERKETKS